jgi:transcriptional regulator with XRE-family HTH domain
MAMSTNSKAALELKRLREQAGYSVRQIAAALRDIGSKYGQSPSSYAYYENDYKKTYLPVDLVDALTSILRDRGTPPIGERQVLALAGADRKSLWVIKPTFTEKPGFKSKIEIETDLFTEVIRGVQVESEALDMDLTPQQQSRLVTEICRRISTTDAKRQPGLVGWEIAHACRFAKALLQ